eukprot:GFYU01003797.1.p1 GENE.GFYU01003797.1~~GFYU01003797.1.p1  ORF type:complete len:506 (+),score=180.96 GFYU01003797.1:110-1519(+)
MHGENRANLVSHFKTPDVLKNSVLYIKGGDEECRYDTDFERLFRQESNFQYLFGVREPGCQGIIEIDTGKSTLFIPRLPEEYAIWMGRILTCDDFKQKYLVDEVRYVDEIPSIMKTIDPAVIYTLKGVNSDSGATAVEATFAGIENYRVDNGKMFVEIVECRVIKSAKELELMRYVNNISSAAHVQMMRTCKPGMKEYQLESLFKHDSYFKGGCREQSYTGICGCGPNSSTLHYGHAGAPNDRLIGEGDILLIDMGAEYHCYTSDITTSFPATGKFSDDQKAVYEAVLAARNACLAATKPGASWTDLHALSYRVLAEHLIRMGVLTGEPQELVDKDVVSLFMPHGLGHHMGLDTHDVGGYPKGSVRSTRPGFKSLRNVRDLKTGMVLTIEPGCYFIDMLMDQGLADPVKSKHINKDRLNQFRGFGGVRIEDDVIVTADGVDCMTVVPRTVAEVEAVMAGGEWKIAGQVI